MMEVDVVEGDEREEEKADGVSTKNKKLKFVGLADQFCSD
jgi:hypothetical protein